MIKSFESIVTEYKQQACSHINIHSDYYGLRISIEKLQSLYDKSICDDCGKKIKYEYVKIKINTDY